MPARDEFTASVRSTLASRVAYRCSNPNCRASTSGPQVRPDKSLNVGVAAHVTAAAPGEPRFNSVLSQSERRDVSNGIWLCQTCAKLIDNDEHRFTEARLHEWKRSSERDALAAVGKTVGFHRTPNAKAREKEIKRDLALRDKMHKDFLKPVDARRIISWKAKPFSKFSHTEVLVRSLEDTKYPEVDENPIGPMSSWVKHEVYDFYHNGLVVIGHMDKGIIDRDGNWAIIPYTHSDDPIDRDRYQVIKVWVLGRIPWRNIRHYDLGGDDYYNFPHLFCSFADDGTPYEELAYAICGEAEDHD